MTTPILVTGGSLTSVTPSIMNITVAGENLILSNVATISPTSMNLTITGNNLMLNATMGNMTLYNGSCITVSSTTAGMPVLIQNNADAAPLNKALSTDGF